jgi:hypothetical protein
MPCTVGGIEFPGGIEVPDLDGCNQSLCVNGKPWLHTLLACPSMFQACIVNGVTYENGASNVPDPASCNCCSCVDGRVTHCTSEQCALPAPCDFGVAHYQDGHGFTTREGSFACTCKAGKFECGPAYTSDASLKPNERPATCSVPEDLVGPAPSLLRPGPEQMRAAELDLPESIDPRWVDEDLAMIRSLHHALPPEPNPREWLSLIPKLHASKAIDLGFGLERIEAGMLGRYGNCALRLVLFNSDLVELRVECSFGRWDVLGSGLTRAFGPAFELAANGDRGEAKLSFASGQGQQAARAALETVLGTPSNVRVPLELASAYEILTSTFSRLALGTACETNGGAPTGRSEVMSLARAKRYDLLRNVLRGACPEGRLYAAWALETAKALAWSDRAVVEQLGRSPLEVMVCRGYWFHRVGSPRAVEFLRED